MNKIRLFHRTLSVILGAAAAWLVGFSPRGASELEMKPDVGTYTDGVYEVSKTEPKSVRVYSKPFSVVPGGVYRFKMNACWFGEGGGCFPAGLDGLSNDYKPKESETPETLCKRVIRVWDNRDQARLSVGRWDSTKTIRFTEPQLVPVSPIYHLVREGAQRGPGSLGLTDGVFSGARHGGVYRGESLSLPHVHDRGRRELRPDARIRRLRVQFHPLVPRRRAERGLSL